jgi:beta-glucosidase
MSSFKTLFGRGLLVLLALSLVLSACSPAQVIPTLVIPTLPLSPTSAVSVTPPGGAPATPPVNSPSKTLTVDYKNPNLPVAQRVASLLGQMTLAEKIGQMTQIENNSIQDTKIITQKFLGSVLSGGDGEPTPNTADAWIEMVKSYQEAALQTRLGIPLLYGVDAVHGFNSADGSTVYPHNIGLGATGDAALAQQIGRATAEEISAVGILWTFSPVVAVAQDIRWGRTYESYSENTDLVTKLSEAYITGLQGSSLAAPTSVLATAKHFIGDGGTAWGSSTTSNYKIDQGNDTMDEAALRALFLPPYQAAIKAGALSVMASFSSVQGVKMHANAHLLTDVLKGELGFRGFVVSDWAAVDQVSPDYSVAVTKSINAGIDMVMVPYDANKFIDALTQAVQTRAVSQARIDDAVSRILTAKFELGLFERPLADGSQAAQVGSQAHRQLARQAVAESQVLLKNDAQTLPLAKNTPRILVAGQAADNIGIQCGGWTVSWQGKAGAITTGTTILKGIQAVATGNVEFNRFGTYKDLPTGTQADVAIVVVGEMPYAEGVGDASDLALSQADSDLISRVRPLAKKLVVLLVSGRPMIINDALKSADAFVAAWLPGTEGEGVADVLFGDKPFTGKLPFTWPKSMDQLPFNFSQPVKDALFPFGYGLTK